MGKGLRLQRMRRSVLRESGLLERVGPDCRLDALTRKDQNLGLFHALGKIMYNKRKLHVNHGLLKLMIRPWGSGRR